MHTKEAKSLIRSGKLREAREYLAQVVRKKPGDVAARTLLFQVLILHGEWEKAERHCDMISAQDEKAFFGVGVFKNLLQAEKERDAAIALSRRPAFLPEAPKYFEKYDAALRKLADGETEEAARLFDDIEAERPVIEGTLNGERFSGFRDTDACFVGFLEIMAHDRYVWIPFEAIRELIVTEPESLFDLIWVPGRITLWDGMTINAFLPVCYPGSGNAEDDRIKMGRLTDWAPLGHGLHRAAGQHVYEIGGKDVSLLEIREVLFTRAAATDGEEAP